MGLYRSTETEPKYARMSFEDSAASVYFDKSGLHVTGEQGWRSARANVCLREGRWYYESKVTCGHKDVPNPDGEARPHVRFGFSRRESLLTEPVGSDSYSYSIRDTNGETCFMSRPRDFGEKILEGDVIGLEINIPSYQLHKKIVDGTYDAAVDHDDEQLINNGVTPNVVRDRLPIKFKNQMYFEQINYESNKELEWMMWGGHNPNACTVHTKSKLQPNHALPCMRTLPGSYIKVYKNGKLLGTAWEDLLSFLPPASEPAAVGARKGLDDGMVGYYPAVALFRGGAAQMNFGPDFWFPPEDYTHPKLSNNTTTTTDAEQKENGNGDALSEGQPTLRHSRAELLKRLRPVCERYDEQIAEDEAADILDEAFFLSKDEKEKNDLAQGVGEEIRELVQDY
jgi:COMPASS component BRE2